MFYNVFFSFLCLINHHGHYVVYDQIIPIVDNENFLILGLTVALAWELPSKPSYPSSDESHDGKLHRKYDKKNTTLYVGDATQTTKTKFNLYDHEHYHNYINDDFRKYLLAKITEKLATNAYQSIRPIKFSSPSLPNRVQSASNIFFEPNAVPKHSHHPYYRYPALRARRDISAGQCSDCIENQHSLAHHISSRERLYERIVHYLKA